METDTIIHIIGAGLAGSEAAWQIANAGGQVVLHEMRPAKTTDAHQSSDCAELVCSNSFRSDDHEHNAVGVLHQEMRLAGSLIMAAADATKLPAGGALAVDREEFAHFVTRQLEAHDNITLERGEIAHLPIPGASATIIATGPLTSDRLGETLLELTGEDGLAFFDAIAPILHKDSIDFDKVWFQSRYDKPGPGGTGSDYINCALDEEQYEQFINDLVTGEKTDFREWEKNTPYFEGCLPIEVMAERGPQTLRYGPMKPVGLTNPHQPDIKPYAVIQLRQDNALGSLWNMVGFQTKLIYGEQKRIFRNIPGLEKAVFARLGGLHRNSFLNSPKLLDKSLRLKSHPALRFAGQITGVEGYVESSAMGLLAGRFALHELQNGKQNAEQLQPPPPTTAHGALIEHLTGGHLVAKKSFQPMNVNFGLFPPVEFPSRDAEGNRIKGKKKGIARKQAHSARALADFASWLESA
ncbi:MAG: methylenetetrahydrofolate--tRNA-(uracil(54)-C(5))-methyltransferase (FADH(2)-oxidizing) TrmFO [Hyphomicrobiaceae bacterium]|nr:methylenetetrahydrofolate--tRNA-(uracil(54)-C(5))-methyltransferase (FADH(2)-oxidizing) TrmFO [Hyphomicrobiaceae bacterium]